MTNPPSRHVAPRPIATPLPHQQAEHSEWSQVANPNHSAVMPLSRRIATSLQTLRERVVMAIRAPRPLRITLEKRNLRQSQRQGAWLLNALLNGRTNSVRRAATTLPRRLATILTSNSSKQYDTAVQALLAPRLSGLSTEKLLKASQTLAKARSGIALDAPKQSALSPVGAALRAEMSKALANPSTGGDLDALRQRINSDPATPEILETLS